LVWKLQKFLLSDIVLITKEEIEMQNSSVKNHASCIMHNASRTIFLILALLLPAIAFAVPQMADYCYLPPFVTDPNTTPNVMFVYEKGSAIQKRAYRDQDVDGNIDNYASTQTYAGFFDSSANYTYNSSNNWFEKANCNATAPPDASDANCFSGNLLNWALMSTLDITREVLAGFGWPASSGGNAGEVFTYQGCFRDGGTAATCAACSGSVSGGVYTYTVPANCQAPVSKGQLDDGSASTDLPTVTVTLESASWTYGFRVFRATGSNETQVIIRIKLGTTVSMTGQCRTSDNCYEVVGSGTGSGTAKAVKMKFGKACSNNSATVCDADNDCSSGGVCSWETRYGLIQKYADKDQNYAYDSDAPRFGIRRWRTGAASDDRNVDMLCDNATSGNCTSTDKTEFLENLLAALSKEPITDDDDTLEIMMKDIALYFNGDLTATYDDKDGTYTQTPYTWSTDPAKNCRKTYAIFLTTGGTIDDGTASNYLSSASCSSLDATLKTEFAYNTCYGFNTDLYTTDGGTASPQNKWQNIKTYVVHTKFYGTGTTSTTIDKLTYASRTVGGGEYLSVSDPATLQSKIEEAFLSILSTSASASTVATLTTQTRESSTLTQAYFYPKRENTSLKWLGYLRLLWSDSGANLREDTQNTGWLDLRKDKILSFYYDPDLVAYKGRTFTAASTSPYLTINTCDPTDSGVTTKLNDNILSIWNAQDKLLDMDFSTAAKTRNIKIGIGNTSGVVTGSDCTTTSGSGCYSFSTTLKSTLQPFWNFTSTCSSGDTTRWCAASANCNYCSDSSKLSTDADNIALTGRSCSSSSDCKYCDASAATTCADSTTTGGCYLPDNGTCSGFCSVTIATACTSDSGCPSGETCGKAGNTCTGNAAACTGDIDCTVNYGPCVTTNLVCNTGISCTSDCTEDNCAYQTIRFVMGYDYPKNASGTVASPGSGFRIRSQCTADADCTGGTCGSKKCRATSATCSSDSDCTSANPGDICVGTCSSASYDVVKTLKLGDIVYSTPRISPNSAVAGYDVTYTDTSYDNFVGSTTVANATPIVIVGANDGMVHAFQVSKIKELSPVSETSGSDTTTTADGSYQTARFSDYPPTSDSAPDTDCTSGGCLGKELWAYIPFNAVPYLRWYCEESYCHIPMVDARFTVVDASIDYDKNGSIGAGDTDALATATRECTTTSNCVWRRLLIGAMGVGGKQITVGSNTWSSSVFVLDITDTTTPKLLWERPLPDRSLTTGTPAIVRLSTKTAGGSPAVDTENGSWYVVFGSGPSAVGTNTATYKSSNAKIFVFNLRTGENMTKGADGTDMTSDDGLDIGTSGVAVGDLLAVDMDTDYQVDDIYFGTYGGSGASQTGKFYRLRIRDTATTYQTTPSDWDIETVVDTGRPIFASPEIASDASGNRWLYFGTGLYLTLDDVTPTAYCSVATTTVCTADSDCPSGQTCTPVTGKREYLYGVKEPQGCWNGTTSPRSDCTYPTPATSFLDTTNIKFTGAKAIEAGCFCAGQLMSTIACTSTGDCSGSCGTNKVCSNNTTQSCSIDSQCPTGGTCIDNKVILKVNNATISGSGVPTSPNNCTNKVDTDAIACVENNVNNVNGNGCNSGGTACVGWRREIFGQKMYSKPFVAGGLVDFTSYQPTSSACSLGGSAHLISLHYTTGTAYVQPTIFTFGGTSGTGVSDIEIKASVNLGTGVPPLGESLVALPLAGDTYKVITQVSGGLPGTSMAPSLPARSGYVLWIVK